MLPIHAMHGSPRRLTALDPAMVGTTTSGREEDEVGFFFTRRRRTALRYARGPNATIVHALLSPSNPYRVTGAEWGSCRGLSPREAHDAGHDVYVVSPYNDGPMWIALDPTIIQIVRIEGVLIGRMATAEHSPTGPVSSG